LVLPTINLKQLASRQQLDLRVWYSGSHAMWIRDWPISFFWNQYRYFQFFQRYLVSCCYSIGHQWPPILIFHTLLT